MGTTCESTPPAETARPSGTGNKSPVVRPAWQRRTSTRHAWTAAERVKSEPKKKTLATTRTRGRPQQLAWLRRRRSRWQQPTTRHGPSIQVQHQLGVAPSNADLDCEFVITSAAPAPRTRDCARVVHMRARWLTYVCVPPHGEGDRQHVARPAIVRALRRPGLANGCGRGLPHHHVCWTGGPSYTGRRPMSGQ